jgi:hypothetical protein
MLNQVFSGKKGSPEKEAYSYNPPSFFWHWEKLTPAAEKELRRTVCEAYQTDPFMGAAAAVGGKRASQQKYPPKPGEIKILDVTEYDQLWRSYHGDFPRVDGDLVMGTVTFELSYGPRFIWHICCVNEDRTDIYFVGHDLVLESIRQ